MATPYTDQLTEINNMITYIMTAGQFMKRGDQMVELPKLDVLLKERARIQPLADAESAGANSPVYRYGIPVRSR